MATIEKIRQVQLVGRKIRRVRKEHKLTQVELSARLGIQQSDLSRMEQGEYRVSLDTLFRILAEFKMSIGEFFEGVAQESITPRDVQLVQEFNSLPRDAQREVEDFIAFKRVQTRSEGPGEMAMTGRSGAGGSGGRARGAAWACCRGCARSWCATATPATAGWRRTTSPSTTNSPATTRRACSMPGSPATGRCSWAARTGSASAGTRWAMPCWARASSTRRPASTRPRRS